MYQHGLKDLQPDSLIMRKKKVEGVCKLCLTHSELMYSHIIPEFFFRYMYDDKSRALLVEAEYLGKTPIQKGIREYMLCLSCEKRLNVYETYVAKLWKKDFPEMVQDNMFIMKDIDYGLFRLFHLSILWRASVSTLDFFKHVSLGKHEEIIRTMILNYDPGKADQYSFIPRIVYDTDKKNIHAIAEPLQAKQDGFTFYNFSFGGVMWEYMVSVQSCRKLSNTYPFFSEEGKLCLTTENIFENERFKTVGKKLVEQHSLKKQRDSLSRKGVTF